MTDAPLVARADLFYCLAAAFMPPPAAVSARDWCVALADDLDSIGGAMALDTRRASSALREYAASWQERESWLVEYSRLFLVPPVEVTLNTGLYLEGCIGGTASQMMRQCYAQAGLAQRDGFHDLPDHAAMQLEFVAALYERAAEGDTAAAPDADEFVEIFVAQWAQALCDACDRAATRYPAAAVFGELSQLLVDAVGCRSKAGPATDTDGKFNR